MPAEDMELKRLRIIPDLFEKYDPSSGVDMRIFYPPHKEVTNGITLKSKETNLGRPHVEVHGPDADLYTLILTHMDEDPSHPDKKEKVQWIVCNIPGSLTPMEEIWAKGLEVTPYQGAKPETGGHHRYVFLLFKQAPGKAAPKTMGAKTRYGFSTQTFVKSHNLSGPVACTYFFCDLEVKSTGAPFTKFDSGIEGINVV